MLSTTTTPTELFPDATPTKIVLISRDKRECPPCGANARSFEKNGIEAKFEVEQIDGNDLSSEQLDWLRTNGLAQTPVMFTPLDAPLNAVAGFRPDVVKQLVTYAQARDEQEEQNEVGAA